MDKLERKIDVIKYHEFWPALNILDAVALTFFPALKTFRLMFLRMRDICKIINVQRKDKTFMV